MVSANLEGAARRETASLVLQSLMNRIRAAVSRPGADHPMLRPTVFVPVRKGDELTYEDVVARKV